MLNYISAKFPHTEDQLLNTNSLKELKKGKFFGCVQCDNEVPEKLKAIFANFPSFFKNTLISRNDISDCLKGILKKEE